MHRFLCVLMRSIFIFVIRAKNECSDSFFSELKMHLNNSAGDVTVNIPEFANHFNLDPARKVIENLHVSVPHSLGCSEACWVESLGRSECIDFTMKVNHVDIHGGSTLNMQSIELVECSEVGQGDVCAGAAADAPTKTKQRCSYGLGDAASYGLDVRLKTSSLMSNLTLHVDLKGGEGNPDGLRAVCKNKSSGNVWDQIFWYGIADCIVQNVRVDLTLNLCGAACDGSSSKDIMGFSCIDVTDVHIAFDQASSKCVFSEAYNNIGEIIQFIDGSIFRQVADTLEVLIPERAESIVDLVFTKFHIPRSCTSTRSDASPETNSDPQLIAA